MSDEPSGVSPALRVTLATPWYPTPHNRMGGSYVADHARLVSRIAGRVRVVHAAEWPGGPPASVEALHPSFDRVLQAAARAGGLELTGAVGPVCRVPVFIVGGQSVPERAEAAVRDVRQAIGRIEGDVVHGHVGYLGGLLAARLSDPSSRVFATEHSSGLRAQLEDPRGRDQYEEVLARAEMVFCVSGMLRNQILAALPAYEQIVEVLPNPVDFEGAPRRAAAPESLDRWVFVGGLSVNKGVERLVRAFCAVAADDPKVSLTMYGDGPLRDRLVELATGAGVADRLELAGVIPHSELLRRLPGYDLLLAPSVYETFHLAVPEAVAAGVPVIVTRSGGPEEVLAGVADLVGRFVDVGESPDELVDAYRDLTAGLGRLDLDAARQKLDSRLGYEAVTRRYAQAYGLPEPATRDGPAEPVPDGRPEGRRRPERVLLLATSGWRRYAVREELSALRRAEIPAWVVTSHPEVAAMAEGMPLPPPAAVRALAGDPPAPQVRVPIRVTARRAAGRAWRAVRGRPASAKPDKGIQLTQADLRGATVLVTDCQSMPLAERLLQSPGLPAVFELDRTGPLAPPPDSREET